MSLRRVNDWALGELRSGPLPFVAFFSASGCSPCDQAREEIRLLVEAYEDVEFVEIDLEEHPSLIAEYRIEAVPTTVIFLHGSEAIRHVGPGIVRPVRMALGPLPGGDV